MILSFGCEIQIHLEIVTNELCTEQMVFGRWIIEFLIKYFESDNSKKDYLINDIDTATTRNQKRGQPCHKFHVIGVIKKAIFQRCCFSKTQIL